MQKGAVAANSEITSSNLSSNVTKLDWIDKIKYWVWKALVGFGVLTWTWIDFYIQKFFNFRLRERISLSVLLSG